RVRGPPVRASFPPGPRRPLRRPRRGRGAHPRGSVLSPPETESTPVSHERALKRLLASARDAWLAARALGWLCALPVLKRTLALERLVRLMWLAPGGNARDSGQE